MFIEQLRTRAFASTSRHQGDVQNRVSNTVYLEDRKHLPTMISYGCCILTEDCANDQKWPSRQRTVLGVFHPPSQGHLPTLTRIGLRSMDIIRVQTGNFGWLFISGSGLLSDFLGYYIRMQPQPRTAAQRPWNR
jgi:hypothetical protein